MIRIIYPDRKTVLFETGESYVINRDMILIYDDKGDNLAAFYRMDGLAVTKCTAEDFSTRGVMAIDPKKKPNSLLSK